MTQTKSWRHSDDLSDLVSHTNDKQIIFDSFTLNISLLEILKEKNPKK